MFILIGIVAQQTWGHAASYGKSYIAADYVKYIEAAGGRVVPIPYPSISTTSVSYIIHLSLKILN